MGITITIEKMFHPGSCQIEFGKHKIFKIKNLSYPQPSWDMCHLFLLILHPYQSFQEVPSNKAQNEKKFCRIKESTWRFPESSGYPQSSTISRWIFHEINHPAILGGYPHDELETPIWLPNFPYLPMQAVSNSAEPSTTVGCGQLIRTAEFYPSI